MALRKPKARSNQPRMTDKDLSDHKIFLLNKAVKEYDFFLNEFLNGRCDAESLATAMQRCNDLEMVALKDSDKSHLYIRDKKFSGDPEGWFGEYDYYAQVTGWKTQEPTKG